jgi:hypothetical protein
MLGSPEWPERLKAADLKRFQPFSQAEQNSPNPLAG